MNIKRSMSVRPSPIVEKDCARSPSRKDKRWGDYDDYGDGYNWCGPWGYVITRVTNSTEYRPGLHLTIKQVNELIEIGWTVSILSKV
jgi:hypothetical protein